MRQHMKAHPRRNLQDDGEERRQADADCEDEIHLMGNRRMKLHAQEAITKWKAEREGERKRG